MKKYLAIQRYGFLFILLLVSIGYSYSQVPDSIEGVVYYNDCNRVPSEKYKINSYISLTPENAKFSKNRFMEDEKSIYGSELSLKVLDFNSLQESFTISFWIKTTMSNAKILEINDPDNINIQVYIENSIIYYQRIQNLGKKYTYGRVRINNYTISDNEWHHVTFGLGDVVTLFMKVDTLKSARDIDLYKKNFFLKSNVDEYGAFRTLDENFSTKVIGTIGCKETYLDDIIISNTPLRKTFVDTMYFFSGYDFVLENRKRKLEEERNRLIAESKRLEMQKFTNNSKVLEYLSNKEFLGSKETKIKSIRFDWMAQNAIIDGVRYKIASVNFINDYHGFIDLYEYDPRLSITFQVDVILNKLGIGDYIWQFSLNQEINSSINSNSVFWDIKGIAKVEKLTSNNGVYTEILMHNPGKFVEIRNGKDLKITDVDIFTLIFGRENLLYFNTAEFTDGTIFNSGTPSTTSYKGKVLLKNSSGSNQKFGNIVLHFYSGNGVKLLQINSEIGNSSVRLYLSDKVGFKIE